MGLQTGYGMTRKEFEMYKALALARNDVKENRKKFWKNSQITDADIEYMKKAMDAPDVNLFLKVM